MPFVIGIVLSLSVALFASRVGFDRDRAFYPTVLIVIGLYYVLFAAMSESVHTVLVESLVMTGFSIAADVGFKSSAWIVVGGLAGHDVFDARMAMSWRTQGCQLGGQPFVSPMTSERQPALPGSSNTGQTVTERHPKIEPNDPHSAVRILRLKTQPFRLASLNPASG
jgi:hypothetical protein